MRSEIVTLSRRQFQRMKPRASDYARAVIIMDPDDHLDDRKYSPMWHIMDVARIPKVDSVSLRENSDVRYVMKLASVMFQIEPKFYIVCDTGAHESIALAQAVHRSLGSQYPTPYPGRPFLESIFYSLTMSR